MYARFTVSAGEPCPACGQPLKVQRAIEVGHVFKLGTKYSVSLNALFLDEAGQKPRHQAPQDIDREGAGGKLPIDRVVKHPAAKFVTRHGSQGAA